MLFLLLFVVLVAMVPHRSAADSAGLNTMDYRFAIVLDEDFASTKLSDFEGGKDFNVLSELKSIWAQLARENLGQLPLKVEFHTRFDIILRKDLSAVLIVASCKNMWRLYNNSEDSSSLLYLAVTEEDCPRLPSWEGITVPVVTKGEELSQILSDLRAVQEISWPSMLVIFDAWLDPERLKRVLKAMSEAQPKVRYIQPTMELLDLGYFSSYDMVRQTISDFPNLHRIEHFLVVTGRENVFIVMKIAKSLRLVNPSTQWLYVLPESQYYTEVNDERAISLLHEGDNVAFLINSTRHTSDTQSCTEGGILCYSRELLRALVAALVAGANSEQEMQSRVALDEWEVEKLSIAKRRQILLAHITKGISTQLENLCDGCVAWKLRSALTWGMKGPAGLNGVESASLEDIGVWRPGAGVDLTDPLFLHSKHGFRGKQLTVVSCHAPPWHEIEFNEFGQVSRFTGFIFDILNELSSRLNFTYRVVFPANTVKGLAAEGREPTLDDAVADERSPMWDQMIDLVQQNGVFLAAAAMSMAAGREMRVNFTLAVASQPHTFLVSKPRQMSRTLLFLSPFTTTTWAAIFGSTLLVGPVLYIIHKLSPATDGPRDPKPKAQSEPVVVKTGGLNTVMNCIWYMYGALMQQGAVHLPRSNSGRLVFGIWWIFVMVIVTSYCGNLVAFLTFPRMDPAVTTLTGLLKQKGTLTWGLLRGSALEKLLEDSSVPEYAILLNKAERHATVDDALLERVAGDNHVLLDRRSRLLILQSLQLKRSGYCSFALASDDFLPEQIGLAMPLQSPYTTLVNKEIRRMQQAGLIDLWLKSAMPRRDRCWVTPQSQATEVSSHSVNLDDMHGSFIVLGIGLVGAFLAAILERCFRCLTIMKARGIIEPFVN